jgi:hypothetical protein
MPSICQRTLNGPALRADKPAPAVPALAGPSASARRMRRDLAILLCREAGFPTADLAEFFGLTPQQINNRLRDTRAARTRFNALLDDEAA